MEAGTMGNRPLDDLFGGQDDDDDRSRARAVDFIGRYETGQPHEDYTDEEAVHHYRTVAGRLTRQEYEDASNEAFDRLSYEHRGQLKRVLRQQTAGRLDVQNDDPRDLAHETARFREQESGGDGLISLFGGGGGGVLDNPLARIALGGIAAVAMKKVLSRQTTRPPEPRPAWIRRTETKPWAGTLGRWVPSHATAHDHVRQGADRT